MKDPAEYLSGSGGKRRDRAEQLYAKARTLRPEARAPFLDEACHDDAALRSELASLLENSEAAEAFFARLAEVVLPHDFSTERAIGNYEIVGFIGAGGMGTVYRAHDTRLHRDVALKFLPAALSIGFRGAERLLMEARAAAALEHPNVCTVYELSETDDGHPFIAMAFYDGETLKERLVRGPLTPVEAVDVAVQIARGLGAAHARGIVHRDVKPGNIMVTRDGTVKLLDFGLAKAADVSATAPGLTPGTAAYMSPEQVRSEAVDQRSDLWSLGVVLYEMLTGVRPFRGGNDRAVIQSILHDRPEQLRTRTADVPRSLERIVERCIQKQPEARYGSADELLADLSALTSVSPTTASRFRGPRRWLRPALLTTTGALLAGLGAKTLWVAKRAPEPANTVALETIGGSTDAARFERARTIAVLPFANLSRDPEEEFFSDGLTEEVIGVLAQVRALRVAARTSAFAFKDENRDIREIGAALNVGTILEGSVRRVGDRVRVSAQLINVDDGFHIWSESYDRGLTDIFEIQRDLALRIASALEAELSPAERERLNRPPTSSADAFTLYLRGRHFWNRRTSAGFARAIEYFQRAIDIDSQYAAAYAGLATVYSLLGLSGELPPAVAEYRMRTAAFKAVELDDGSAEAHAALGSYYHTFGWNSAAAEREYLRAIELDPSYATTRHFYGNLLRSMGRVDEALAQKTKALELDPLDPVLSESLAFTALSDGRLDQALHHVQNVLELDSTFGRAYSVMGLIHEVAGSFDDALGAHIRAQQLGAMARRSSADVARVLARLGREQEARQLLRQLEAEAFSAGKFEPHVASLRLALDDVDGALEWLELAYRAKHPGLRFIPSDPRFAPLLDDPRYLDLLRRVGLRS